MKYATTKGQDRENLVRKKVSPAEDEFENCMKYLESLIFYTHTHTSVAAVACHGVCQPFLLSLCESGSGPTRLMQSPIKLHEVWRKSDLKFDGCCWYSKIGFFVATSKSDPIQERKQALHPLSNGYSSASFWHPFRGAKPVRYCPISRVTLA